MGWLGGLVLCFCGLALSLLHNSNAGSVLLSVLCASRRISTLQHEGNWAHPIKGGATHIVIGPLRGPSLLHPFPPRHKDLRPFRRGVNISQGRWPCVDLRPALSTTFCILLGFDFTTFCCMVQRVYCDNFFLKSVVKS